MSSSNHFDDEIFYHATSIKKLKNIAKAGMNTGSYWTNNFDLVGYYAETIEDDNEESIVLIVFVENLDKNSIKPDFPGIEEPISTVLNKNESAVYIEWEKSRKTWEDSLEIIGSICYHQPILSDNIFVDDNGELVNINDYMELID